MYNRKVESSRRGILERVGNPCNRFGVEFKLKLCVVLGDDRFRPPARIALTSSRVHMPFDPAISRSLAYRSDRPRTRACGGPRGTRSPGGRSRPDVENRRGSGGCRRSGPGRQASAGRAEHFGRRRLTLWSMKKLAARSPAVPCRRLKGSAAMKAWAWGLAVKSAGSDRGIGNSLRRFVNIAQAICSFSRKETPTRGKSPGQMRAMPSTSSGCSAAVISATLPPQLMPARVIGTEGCSSRIACNHSVMSLTSRRPEEACPRSRWLGPEPRRWETKPDNLPRPAFDRAKDTSRNGSDAVQHDDLTLERLRGRPHGHMERITVGRYKGAVFRLHFSHKRFRDARWSSLRGPRDRRRYPGPDQAEAWPYRRVRT